MISLSIQNAGTDGAKRDAILEYLQDALPSRNTKEQNLSLIGNILKEMGNDGVISLEGKIWRAIK